MDELFFFHVCKNWQESLFQLDFRPMGDLEFNIIYVSVYKKKKQRKGSKFKKIIRTQLRSDSFPFWNHSIPFPLSSLLKSDDYSSGLKACYIEVRIFIEIGQHISMLFHKQGARNVSQIPGTNSHGSAPAAGIQTIRSPLCCINCCAQMLN